jgi:serine/threonine protein kinase/tetratricopeptide (TPR) repeat protein
MPPGPGVAIGAYELLELLGKGGMGEVYRARDSRLGRLVAIKVLSSDLRHNATAAARLDREAKLASSLNHPGIVTVFDVGRFEDRPFLVMELVEGEPLATLLARRKLKLAEAVDIACQTADALAAAHEAGMVHRDLKPQNIMISSSGRVKIVDFGLSKMTPLETREDDSTIGLEALTAERAVIGTVGYMAPEQVSGKALDARTDQFALGAILYEMLTGKRAFKRETSFQTMAAILDDDLPPLSQSSADVPPPLEAIAARCLAKRPQDRYGSTRDLAHDLREAQQTIALDSRSQSSARLLLTPRPSSRWRRAWPVALLIGLAAVGFGLWRVNTTPSAPSGTVSTTPAIRYIALLPFNNITKDPADDVFADGLLETLASSLTELERFQRTLRVVPVTEVRSARVTSAREARQAFGATLAITGALQRGPASVRLTLNLVDANALAQVAARTIEMSAGQEQVTQEAVVGAITGLLSLQLDPRERDALVSGSTSNPEAYGHYLRARGYLQRFDRGVENVDRAIDGFTRATAADSRYALAHAGLGEAYWRKYEIDRNAQWITAALDHCREALGLDSQRAPVHITLALIARGQGQYEEAIAVATRALQLDPVSSEAYRELGRAHEGLRQWDAAEATYRKAIEARPDDWLAFNTLGAFYLARGRPSDAEPAFRRVIDLTPDNTRGYNNLGVTYYALGRREEAAATWERSIAIRPTYSATSNLGSYYYARGRYADAARAYEKAADAAPNDYRMWRNLGAALYWTPGERGKAAAAYERAVQLAEEAHKVNPRQVSTLLAIADAYSILGRPDPARRAIALVERLAPDDGESLYTLASVHEQLRDRDGAMQWLAKAVTAGYPRETIERSPWLADLRTDPRYPRLFQSPQAP